MTQHDEALENCIAKWRARWPEWRIAEVFVPAAQRDIAAAWFALLQELTDAAWAGDDATPGLAKLAWWEDELQGWSQGRRRHPLGATLQSRNAPWMALSNGLPELCHLRRLPQEVNDGITGLRPFTEGVMAIETTLFDESPACEMKPSSQDLIAVSLLATHPALMNEPGLRTALSSQWPEPRGPRTRRIVAALIQARLAGAAAQPLPPWRALWLGWRAARH